jgi:hypothetical protein
MKNTRPCSHTRLTRLSNERDKMGESLIMHSPPSVLQYINETVCVLKIRLIFIVVHPEPCGVLIRFVSPLLLFAGNICKDVL